MGVFDKIKNALFEVEYVEVDEPPKKEKKVKKKGKDNEVEEEKPIAKRIILPGKKEEKVEELKEEELLDEDFEIKPQEEPSREQFKFMDDNDFKVEDEPVYLDEKVEEQPVHEERPLYGETKQEVVEEVYTPITTYNNPNYKSSTETNLYGMNNHSSYNVPVHQYGTYEKESKAYFKPSPIISPIYGILDKNYKKEDVREKKEVRLTGYTRSNMDVDDIRAKAYGKEEKETEPRAEENIFEVENVVDTDDNVMVDLSDRSKPEVKELTMGDAEEYFEDLGLEYNVDYVDVSTDRSKIVKEEEKKEEPKEETPVDIEEPLHGTLDDIKIEQEKETEPDDDNLFDLIDSMYSENE